jgi:hypothetical protein
MFLFLEEKTKNKKQKNKKTKRKKKKRKKEQEFYRSEPNFPYENKA